MQMENDAGGAIVPRFSGGDISWAEFGADNNISWNQTNICALWWIRAWADFFMQAKNEIGSAIHRDTPTALVAEDEVLVRLSLAERLRDVGFHVLEAANGEEARKIAVAVGGVIDVVISDVHMAREGEGIAFALWMGEHYPEIPVILASGDKAVPERAEFGACRSVTDFVQKPYSELQMEQLARRRADARSISGK